MAQLPPLDPGPERNPDERKTLLKTLAVIVMFAIAVFGMLYTAHVIWTGK